MRIRSFWEALLVKIWWLQAWKHFSGLEVKHPPKNLPIPVTAARVVLVRLAGSTQVAIRSFIWRLKVTPWKVNFLSNLVELIKIFHQGKVRGSYRTSTGSHMKTLRTQHLYISAVCCWRHSFMTPAQFYETGTVLWDRHRDRINRLINVHVNTSPTQTFPTMLIENCQIFTIFTGWLLLQTRGSTTIKI